MRAPIASAFLLSFTGVLVSASLACGSSGSTSSSASATVSAAPPPRTSATPAPSATASAAKTSTSAAPAAEAFEPSSEPDLSDWGKAHEIKVAGSGKNSCETKLSYEWLRVMCVNRAPDLGTPVGISISKGREQNKHYKGENLHAVNDITTLIVPIRPGTDFAATFTWANGSHELTASWPEGTPVSARTIAFDNGDSPAPAESAAAPVAGSASAAAAVVGQPAVEPPIDDLAGIAEPGADDAWAKAPEARIAGSSAANCETKILGDWFRARCPNPENALDAVLLVKGHRKTQTRLNFGDGFSTLLTPYVEGTETWVRFKSGDTTRTLVLRWTKGPRPATAGSFETGK